MTITKFNASDANVYKVLTLALEFPNEDQRLWWHSTAPMFAQMLDSCNYTIHAQYKYLIEYKNCVIPWLGVYPRNDNNKTRWLSILTRYGTPFELSLNCSDSLVRYTYEPINAHTGTAKDPFNTHAIWDSLADLRTINKGVDLEWLEHFKRDLTLNDEEAAYLVRHNLAGDQIRTQNKLAVDLKPNGSMVKTYIYPTLKAVATGRSIEDLIFTSTYHLAERHPALQRA